MFAGLMVAQWLAGIVAAVWISPKTWMGAESQMHWHVWAAVLLGGVITSFPVALAWKRPGDTLTRHAIAVGQMLTSALLIHLTGGRIETHFHVFGSLAFLAFYRDWKVLITATVVVAVDHFLRGVYWPQSVFGVLTASPWRWVEHAGWVIFEDVFLLASIRQSLRESRMVAERQARLETINRGIEQVVQERTRQLEQSHQQLMEASRQAGMAEVATSVLHNVGNVLNSVNVSATLVADQVRQSKITNVARVSGLLREHASDLGAFMTSDPRGRQIPSYVATLAEHLASEQSSLLNEIENLRKSVEHIKEIVAMQQSYAHVVGVTDTVSLSDLVEHALAMNNEAMTRHEVQVVRDYQASPTLTLEKHKVLQILVNLMRNAKYACDESGRTDKQMKVRIMQERAEVRIVINDNGIGIPAENLTRIFNHGFTTRKAGHGFGLHSAALAARDLGGSLEASSDGPGTGATFTLILPVPTDADRHEQSK